MTLFASEQPVPTTVANSKALALVKQAYVQGHLEEALAQLHILQMQYPNDFHINYYLGLTHKGMLQYRQAVVSLQKSVELHPKHGEAFSHLGEVYHALALHKQALSALNQAERLAGRPAYTAYLKALVLSHLKQYAHAVSAFQNAIQMNPQFTQKARYGMAVAYFHAGQRDAAKTIFQTLSAGSESDETTHYARMNLKVMQVDKKEPDKGNFQFKAAYALTDDDNVILKSAQTVLPLNVPSQQDQRHELKLMARWQPAMTGPWFFDADYRFYLNEHINLKQFNVQGHSLTLSPAYDLNQYRFGIQTVLDDYQVNSQRYLNIMGVYPYVQMAYDQQHSGMLRFGLNQQRYFLAPFSTAENRDSVNTSLAYTHQILFANQKANLKLGVEVGKDQAQGDNWDRQHIQLESSLSYPLSQRLGVEAYIGLLKQNYLHTHSFFAIQRHDRTYTFSSSLHYQISQHWHSSLAYVRQNARSNIVVYHYDRNVFTLSLGFVY